MLKVIKFLVFKIMIFKISLLSTIYCIQNIYVVHNFAGRQIYMIVFTSIGCIVSLGGAS